MNQFKLRIEIEAKEASQIISYDDEKVKAFTKGAAFAIQRLARLIAEDHYDGMMSSGDLAFVDKLRLKDVRVALQFLLENKEVT